jgi:Rad3-related DNA helicase
MSATIGETSDLARRLGTNPITKIPVPPEHAAVTQGRRLLVMNKIDEKDIPARSQIAILAALKVHPKSVWLCESRAEAERFQQIVSEWLNANEFVGHPAWLLSNLGDEIDQFKAAPAGHLFVGGRFDGMDFKEDECRLVVLATLPRAINSQEEFFTAYLRDSGFMLRRLNQRIIQALGRCTRGDTTTTACTCWPTGGLPRTSDVIQIERASRATSWRKSTARRTRRRFLTSSSRSACKDF